MYAPLIRGSRILGIIVMYNSSLYYKDGSYASGSYTVSKDEREMKWERKKPTYTFTYLYLFFYLEEHITTKTVFYNRKAGLCYFAQIIL